MKLPDDIARIDRAWGFIQAAQRELESIQDETLKSSDRIQQVLTGIAGAHERLRLAGKQNIERLYGN